jgi:hypothetical protein
MAMPSGRVELEQSDISFTSNMAKMAKAGISQTAMEETQLLITKPLL